MQPRGNPGLHFCWLVQHLANRVGACSSRSSFGTGRLTLRKAGKQEMKLELEELTGKIIGCAIEVHRELGPAFWSPYMRPH
jgi:hypothetical protein